MFTAVDEGLHQLFFGQALVNLHFDDVTANAHRFLFVLKERDVSFFLVFTWGRMNVGSYAV